MDGVLIDSEPLWKLAEVEVFGGVGVPLTVEMCAETTGMRMSAAVDHWFARYPWSGPSSSEVAGAVVARVSALIAEEGVAMEGAVALVNGLQREGALLGLCSSSPMSLIDAVCARLGLTESFAVRMTAEDCARGKPFPDPYLATA
ncbi:MAG: HAD family hydrolase, partial [Myxococcota bacterium]